MFGSLIVVLPTPHTSGFLLIRHHGKQYTFDSAQAVSSSSSNDAPRAAFIALFSDIEHKVAEVTSGYLLPSHTTFITRIAPRVPARPASRSRKSRKSRAIYKQRSHCSSLTPNFHQLEGFLGFGLSYEYPFDKESTKLVDIERRLKGIDALFLHVFM